MTWTPVNTNRYILETTQDVGRWTDGSIDCYESERNCFNCHNSRITEGRLRWNGGNNPTCFMPLVVQALLDSGIAPASKRFGKRLESLQVGAPQSEVREKAQLLRVAIVAFLSGKENHFDAIINHVNRVGVGEQAWPRRTVSQQIYRLKTFGVILDTGKEVFAGTRGNRQYTKVYAVGNAELVHQMAPVGMAEVG